MKPRQSDDQYLIVGLNPGPTRISASKFVLSILIASLGVSLFGGVSEALVGFWISLPLVIILTCGQQYVLDASEDILKKRRLFFLQSTPWVELGKVTDIHEVIRRKASSEDGEAMNSWIDFNFKDGTIHTWSLNYGQSDQYRDQIITFLQSHGVETTLPNYEVPISTSANETPPVPSSPTGSTVWDTTPKPTKPEPSSESASVWDVAPSVAEDRKHANKSVWDQ